MTGSPIVRHQVLLYVTSGVKLDARGKLTPHVVCFLVMAMARDFDLTFFYRREIKKSVKWGMRKLFCPWVIMDYEAYTDATRFDHMINGLLS